MVDLPEHAFNSWGRYIRAKYGHGKLGLVERVWKGRVSYYYNVQWSSGKHMGVLCTSKDSTWSLIWFGEALKREDPLTFGLVCRDMKWTALHVATYRGEKLLRAELLRLGGEDESAVDIFGFTAADIAAPGGKEAVTEKMQAWTPVCKYAYF